MKTQLNAGLTLMELENQKIGLEDRIKRLEKDLQRPLDADLNEQAGQISNHIILRRILEVERSNLQKVNFEIKKKGNQAI